MTESKKSYLIPMMIIGGLFSIFGFVTWLNSILIPFLQQACQLTDFQAFLVTFAFYISYFFVAIPSSNILNKIGFAKGMAVGLAVMAIGALIFIPAALTRAYPLFLLGLFCQAAGMTLLQTAANPYVTILGPIESAAKRISIMGICNKLAGMTGIFVIGEILFSDAKAVTQKISGLTGVALETELDQLAARVITPYIIMAIILFLFALAILKAHLPEINPEEADSPEEQTAGYAKNKTSALQFPHLILGVLCIFVYVGVEVIAIDALGLYGVHQGFDISVSSKFGIYSLIGLTIGYFLGALIIPKFISQRLALASSALAGIVFTVGVLLTSGWVSIAFVVLLSFTHSFMWPTIWPLSLHSLGRFTKTGSALLIMGIVGGAILPLAYGALADASNRQTAFWIAIPCYAYIIYFALKGQRAGLAARH
jgi:glucose/galactose transporter